MILALASASVGSVQARAATPPPDGSSTTLEAVLQTGLELGMPGLALRVERGDEVLFDQAVGVASIEDQTPLTTSDRFGIGSITKTFTATRILQLVDEGVLSLDDTVTTWLDDPVVRRIPNTDQITLRQLLTHTSGIYDYFADDSPFWMDAYFGEGADWGRVWTPLELVAYADGTMHDADFPPGESVRYSNTAYVLLALIVEEATGQEFVASLRDHILSPLGLADTFFAAAEPVPGGVVDAYHLIEGELVNVSTMHPSGLWTAGGMVSTTRDLARFDDALFGGELLSPQSLQEMLTFIESGVPNFEVGMGVFRKQTPDGQVLVGNSGDGPGAGARMYRLADEDFTVVLITNTGGNEETLDTLLFEAVRVALGSDGPTTT
jgi:CubicO group peptidase (beta-lactamase class C family)